MPNCQVFLLFYFNYKEIFYFARPFNLYVLKIERKNDNIKKDRSYSTYNVNKSDRLFNSSI